MKRFLKIFLPVMGLALVFVGIYFWTMPKNELPEFSEVREALEVLEDYGYRSEQMVERDNTGHFLVCFFGFGIFAAGYFWMVDFFERKKILELIDYVREINEQVYDLKLDENSDAELSLLSNELYKTTVLLKEAANLNKTRARKMEDALADISHQLRTPLTSLQIMIDNLYDNPELDMETRQDFLRTAGRQVEQMSDLVVTLLNIAKLDNGTLKLRRTWVAAQELLSEVVGMLETFAEAHGVELRLSGELKAKMRVDKKWQTQALSNVIKNCVEHSRSGERVLISVEENAVFVRVTIQDFGEGIAAGDLRHIFERFYKAKNARPESVGIGLAFAKMLIEADGGQIAVRSKVGEGTEFRVTYYKG